MKEQAKVTTTDKEERVFESNLRKALLHGDLYLPITNPMVEFLSRGMLRGYVAPDIRRRCFERALAAASVRKLRAAADRTGFEALSFVEYIRRIAYVAGVKMRTIMTFTGIESEEHIGALDQPCEQSASLAEAIGLSLRQLVLHLKLAVLEKHAVPTVTCLRARSGSPSSSWSLAEVEDRIAEVEHELDPAIRERLRSCEFITNRLYADVLAHKSVV